MLQREPTAGEVLSPGIDLRRAVLYSLSGGLLAVAFGMFGCEAAQAAPMPVDTDGVSHARSEGGSRPQASSGSGKTGTVKNTKSKSAPGGGDSGKQQKATPSGNSGEQKKSSKNNDEDPASSKSRDAAEKAASAAPVTGGFVKAANAAKSVAEKVKAAQPKSQGSELSAKLRAEDRQAQASARAGAKANAVAQPKSLREQIGAALEEADEFIDSGLRSSRQSAQKQIDEEKNDPNKTPDAGTTARRFAAGAYAAVLDNVTSTAELVGTLDYAVQGDEEASRKVEQTGKDIVGGVANTVYEPKAAAKKAVAAGEQAWEGFKKAPVSGTGEVLVNLAGARKITRSAETDAVAARAESPPPKRAGTPDTSAGRTTGASGSSTPATDGARARPSTTVAPSPATAVPAVPKAKPKPKPKSKAKAKTRATGAGATATGAGATGRPKVNLKRTEVDGTKYPESAQHIIDNLKPNAKGKYRYDGTVDRPGKKDRRKASLRGVRRKPLKDRDEWPQAVFKEGGEGASVRHIGRSDNRGSGATLGNHLRGNEAGDYRIDDGTKIRVFVRPPKAPTP